MEQAQVKELLLQSLEHETGGVQVYETALKCAINPELRSEWERYLGETRNHEAILTEACSALAVDPNEDSPGRKIIRYMGQSLVKAMEMALSGGDRDAAQLVACECVTLAEVKDHLDWELIGKCSEKLKGEEAKVLSDAYEEVEDQEDEHLYHTRGWCRELWLESLGMKAVLPPPEERKHVKTAISAARAEQQSSRNR
jgi:rubrerythrin